MTIKMQIEAEPLEFYKIVAAIAAVSPFRVVDAGEDPAEPDVGQDAAGQPAAASKTSRKRTTKAAAPAPETATPAAPENEPARPAESSVTATAEMAAAIMHRVFSEVSAQKATEIAIAIQGPKPGLSAATIEATGTAQKLYDAAAKALVEAGKSV